MARRNFRETNPLHRPLHLPTSRHRSSLAHRELNSPGSSTHHPYQHNNRKLPQL